MLDSGQMQHWRNLMITLYVYILLLQIALPLEPIQIPAHCHYESETAQ